MSEQLNPPSHPLLDAAQFLKSLEQYSLISSQTGNAEGVNEAHQFLMGLLKPLGFSMERVERILPSQPPLKTGSLFVARRMVSQQLPTVILVGHADTLDGEAFSSHRFQRLEAEKKIVGQGVLDDKASQLLAIRGLALFLERHPASLNFILLSSPNEELGSQGFHDHFQRLSKDADLLLDFEPALDGKDLVVSRRGNRWYDVRVLGREAHAGRAHAQGINAAHELAFLISKLHALTDYQRDVTVNVGEIRSTSQTYNLVCGEAFAKIDTRFSTQKDRDELHGKITAILDQRHVYSAQDQKASEVSFTVTDDCPPLFANEESLKWAGIYAAEIEKIEGRKIELRKSGGGSDACYLQREGLIVIDGLGACGGNMHRLDEYALIDSFWSRSEALAQFLAKFSNQSLPKG